MQFFVGSQRGNLLAILTVSILAAVLVGGCTEHASSERHDARPSRADVRDDGAVIVFPQGSVGLKQLSLTTVKKGTALISVMAPSRVVASISRAMATSDRIVLFESPDVTSSYSQYRQARANLRLAEGNLRRVKEMFENQGATAKDVNQAENDAANARSSISEMEGRLRALGFNPVELEGDSTDRAWLISEVAENQLREVQKGEDVDVYFSSYPDKKYVGRADAIGDIIDPVTRTVKVRVTVPNPHGRFMPGMYARVDFGDPVSGVITMPVAAVVTVNGEDYVFVESTSGTFHRKNVTILSSGGKEVVALKGLEDGDRVVTGGAMLLKGLSFGF